MQSNSFSPACLGDHGNSTLTNASEFSRISSFYSPWSVRALSKCGTSLRLSAAREIHRANIAPKCRHSNVTRTGQGIQTFVSNNDLLPASLTPLPPPKKTRCWRTRHPILPPRDKGKAKQSLMPVATVEGPADLRD